MGSAEPVGPTVGYRAHLDGLRAVAVYLVVLFHAGTARFSRGFIGVDVFFVLSGYLVTQLLLRDLDTHGGIGLRRFYSRRFRRLLPAAFVVLIVTAALYVAIASPAEALAAVGSFKAAFLYVSNWFFIRESTGYFGADVKTNPVLQFWSLAVEEQFYLLWPLLLGALFAISRRVPAGRIVFVRVAVAAGAIASLVWALLLRHDSPDRAYFGTDARAYQLLAGASIALAAGFVTSLTRYRHTLRLTSILGVAALGLLATGVIDVDPIVRGAIVTVVTCAVIISLEAGPGGFVKSLLSTEPVVYLGKVSYGTYLWHWPVVLVTASLWRLGSLPVLGVVCVVTTGVASLSYQLLERPIRVSAFLDRYRTPVIATGLAISAVSAVVLVPAILDPQSGRTTAAPVAKTSTFTPLPADLDWRKTYYEFFGDAHSCTDAPPEACTIVHGTGSHILLMGDSNAEMMVPAFTKLAERDDLTLSVAVVAGCPWQRDVFRLSEKIRQRCKKEKEDAYTRVIPALDPDLVVVMNASEPRPHAADDPKTTADDKLLRESTRESLAELGAGGRKVLVVEPMPHTPDGHSPLDCLSQADVLEECRWVADTPPTWLEEYERELADANDDLWSADFDRLACPFLPICDPVVDGTVVWWDGQHLTARYSETLADDLGAYLRDNNLIRPGA